MAQLNAPKAFDIQELEPKFADNAAPLVEHINQNFDQVIRALFSQLTLKDNFRGQFQTLSAMNREVVSISTPKDGLSAILPLYVDSGGIKSYSWARTASGTTQITFEFSGAIPIKTRSATFSSPWITYSVTESVASKLKPGDLVSVEGYSNKSNNGEFLLAYVGTNSVVAYNSAGVAETKAEFTGTSETSKSVTVFLFS